MVDMVCCMYNICRKKRSIYAINVYIYKYLHSYIHNIMHTLYLYICSIYIHSIYVYTHYTHYLLAVVYSLPHLLYYI